MSNSTVVPPGRCLVQGHRNNASQGDIQGHTSKRLSTAVIGGVIAGIVVLLLLIILAIILFCRRRPQKRGLRRMISIRKPKTPVLPMQPPPYISLPNPFSDPSYLEKVAPYSIPLEPSEKPFADAWVKSPEACVTREAYDGRAGDPQVQSRAVRRVSLQS